MDPFTLKLDNLDAVAERRMKDKINAILDDPSHLLYGEPQSKTKRFRRSFVPTDIRLYKNCDNRIKHL